MIQLITDWEFKAYTNQKKAKSKNETESTDDKEKLKWKRDMLLGTQETESEIIKAKKITALFSRDLTTFMLNTTIGVLMPALKAMPVPWSASAEELQMYLQMLMACIGEATMFIWSACISSQSIALTMELCMKWLHNKLEKEYIANICEKSDSDLRSRKDETLLFLYNKIGEKHIHGLYVTHENWFILMVLFLWQCQFGWLNPNMFVMGAGTMLYVTTVYKIRFTFLKPKIEKQFIAHLVREECFSYMIYLFVPLQFVILFPFLSVSSVKNVQCNVLIFGLPITSLLITILSLLFYKGILRQKREPYLVSITKHWNDFE